MFDLIASGLATLNQLGVFIAALVCAGLGALLVGSAVYWRLHAVRVQGQVIGVRQSANCFNAVYRYTLPSGESHEATSREGSSSVRGKETGTVAPLLVIPEKPDEVLEARSHVFTFIGALLLGAGAALFYFAATAWPIGPMTWVVAALLVGYLAVRIHRIVLPRDKRLAPAVWKRQRAAVNNVAVQRVEDIVSQTEYRAREAQQRATARRLAPFLLLAGIGLLGLSVYLGRTLVRLETSGLRAPGVVRSLEMSISSGNSPTYYPVVNFETANGNTIRFRDRTGTNPPAYRVGDTVAVLYLPDDSQSAMIDRGIWNWLPSMLTSVFGALLSLLGIRTRRQFKGGA